MYNQIKHNLVLAWAELNQEGLVKNWHRVQDGQRPHQIDGL